MARTIVGSRSHALAVAQARSALADLASEWPDVSFVQRSFSNGDGLLKALGESQAHIALFDLAGLPPTLPEGLELAAVSRRLEPRSALVAKGSRRLTDLPPSARVGVTSLRDAAFVRTARGDLNAVVLSEHLDDALARLASGEAAALVLSAAQLIQLGRRQANEVLLDAELFPPAPGQGSFGLVVRAGDDMAADLAYTLQHRPSFDRVAAERSFARALLEHPELMVGALATVSPEGDLALFGAVTHPEEPFSIQAETSGEAAEAAALGRELAQDVLEQLKQRV